MSCDTTSGTTNLRTIIRSKFSADQLKELKVCQRNTYHQDSPKLSKHCCGNHMYNLHNDDDDNDAENKNLQNKSWYSRPKKVNVKYVVLVVFTIGIIYCVWDMETDE